MNSTTGARTGNHETVDDFNRACPIGTEVLAFPGSREGRAIMTRTRSTAWRIADRGEPVVMVEGYAGGIALSHIEIVPTASATPDAGDASEGLSEAEVAAEFKRRFMYFDGYRSEAHQADLLRVFASGVQYATGVLAAREAAARAEERARIARGLAQSRFYDTRDAEVAARIARESR